MGADSMGPGQGGADHEAGERPYGTRPYGTRPYGTRGDEDEREERPYGTRIKPYGTRIRPYGTRIRPYGTRPYGTRPYGTRPYGTRAADGALDTEEWADDVAELFCETSAVVALGASIVFADHEVDIPSIESEPVVGYQRMPPGVIDPGLAAAAAPANPAPKPVARVMRRILRPREHELAVTALVPDDLVRGLAERPDLAWPLKQDLADGLARVADGGFLAGAAAGPGPCGITATTGVLAPVAGGALGTLRALVQDVRAAGAPFRAPGWVLGPEVFGDLTTTASGAANGSTLDMTHLLTYEPPRLLGYPYALSRAAGRRIFFGADWGEAWIAVDGPVVTVDVSPEARFATDETVVRAVARHDFLVRRPAAFAYATLP